MNRKLFKEMCLTFLLILGMAVLSRALYVIWDLFRFFKSEIYFNQISIGEVSLETYFEGLGGYLVQVVILVVLYETRAKEIIKKVFYYYSILAIELCIWDTLVVMSSIQNSTDIFKYTIWGTNWGHVILFCEVTCIISWVLSKGINKFKEKHPEKVEWYEKGTLKHVIIISILMFLIILVCWHILSLIIVGMMSAISSNKMLLGRWFILLIIGIIVIALICFSLFKRLGGKYYFSFPALYWIMTSPIIIHNLISLYNMKPFTKWEFGDVFELLGSILFNTLFDIPTLSTVILLYMGFGYIIGGIYYKLKFRNFNNTELKSENEAKIKNPEIENSRGSDIP